MDQSDALEALAALSHETRLSTFRLLVTAGPEGLPANLIAARLGVLPNTLSTHLGLLARAGLVTGTREGRVIRYAANFEAMSALMSFLLRDCCGGRPELCAPLVAIAESCSAASAGMDGS